MKKQETAAKDTLHNRHSNQMPSKKDRIIWIDLDNSPHVPFFSPIIKRLESLGYQVRLTARTVLKPVV